MESTLIVTILTWYRKTRLMMLRNTIMVLGEFTPNMSPREENTKYFKWTSLHAQRLLYSRTGPMLLYMNSNQDQCSKPSETIAKTFMYFNNLPSNKTSLVSFGKEQMGYATGSASNSSQYIFPAWGQQRKLYWAQQSFAWRLQYRRVTYFNLYWDIQFIS